MAEDKKNQNDRDQGEKGGQASQDYTTTDDTGMTDEDLLNEDEM